MKKNTKFKLGFLLGMLTSIIISVLLSALFSMHYLSHLYSIASINANSVMSISKRIDFLEQRIKSNHNEKDIKPVRL